MANAVQIINILYANNEDECNRLLQYISDPGVRATVEEVLVTKATDAAKCKYLDGLGRPLQQPAQFGLLPSFVQRRPHFSTNGSLHKTRQYFFLDPIRKNKKLIQYILEGRYILFYGHRGSGKSTDCFYAMDQQGIKAIYVSLEGFSRDLSSFWPRFGEKMADATLDLKMNTVVNSSDSFQAFFRELAQKGKKVTLFIDEFDWFLNKYSEEKHDLLQELLGALRSMKAMPEVYGYQAVVLIGPFTILKAGEGEEAEAKGQVVGWTSSPFNVADSVESEYWNLDETREIFQQFASENNVVVDPRIAQDIYNRTRGHPGLTCFCGKYIEQELEKDQTMMEYDDWRQFASTKLHRFFWHGWRTMSTLIQECEREKNRQFLWNGPFLKSSDVVALDKPYLSIARDLTGVGALRSVGDPMRNEYQISSPLVRDILISTFIRPPPSPAVIPSCEDGGLDVKSFLKSALPLFSRQYFINALGRSAKQNESPSLEVQSKAKVPNEPTYRFELNRFLKAWFNDPDWSIEFEMQAPKGKMKCDLVVENFTLKQVWPLEVSAHARRTDSNHNSLADHLEKAEIYSTLSNTKEAWVISFDTNPTPYKWEPKDGSKVKLAQIYHNYNWTECKITFSDGDVVDVNRPKVPQSQLLPTPRQPPRSSESATNAYQSRNHKLSQRDVKKLHGSPGSTPPVLAQASNTFHPVIPILAPRSNMLLPPQPVRIPAVPSVLALVPLLKKVLPSAKLPYFEQGLPRIHPISRHHGAPAQMVDNMNQEKSFRAGMWQRGNPIQPRQFGLVVPPQFKTQLFTNPVHSKEFQSWTRPNYQFQRSFGFQQKLVIFRV